MNYLRGSTAQNSQYYQQQFNGWRCLKVYIEREKNRNGQEIRMVWVNAGLSLGMELMNKMRQWIGMHDEVEWEWHDGEDWITEDSVQNMFGDSKLNGVDRFRVRVTVRPTVVRRPHLYVPAQHPSQTHVFPKVVPPPPMPTLIQPYEIDVEKRGMARKIMKKIFKILGMGIMSDSWENLNPYRKQLARMVNQFCEDRSSIEVAMNLMKESRKIKVSNNSQLNGKVEKIRDLCLINPPFAKRLAKVLDAARDQNCPNYGKKLNIRVRWLIVVALDAVYSVVGTEKNALFKVANAIADHFKVGTLQKTLILRSVVSYLENVYHRKDELKEW